MHKGRLLASSFSPPKLYLEDRPGMKTLLGYSLKPVKCQEAKKAVPEDWANQNLRMRLRVLFIVPDSCS